MATTTFVNGVTVTDADWFNDIDAAIYQGTFPTGATALTVTGATTLAVFNTIATTVNAFGAASVALNIGNASAAAAFPGGISIPTGKTLSGAGAINITGTLAAGATTITGALTASTSIATGTGTTTTAGLKLLNGTAGLGSGYGAIYAEAEASPDNTNYGLAIQNDSTTTIVNATADVTLRIGGTIIESVTGSGVAVTGTLSATGNTTIGTQTTTAAPIDTEGRFHYIAATGVAYFDSRQPSNFFNINQSYADAANRGAVGIYRSETKVGSISCDSTQTYFNTTSDKDLKIDLGLCSSITVLLDTEVHDFEWVAGGKGRGVFAQDAYHVKPAAVTVGSNDVDSEGRKTNPWGVDYSKYVPDLIVGWQNHESRLAALESRVLQ